MKNREIENKMTEYISLSQLTSHIQNIIRSQFDSPVWIRAEISELRENPGGHCYLELVEKQENSNTLAAKAKATIWANTYRMLKPYFESTTGQSLQAGMTILVAVSVEFHGLYGFSLNIRDIDPTFTIGEMAARRLKIIRQLEADGIVEMNKQLTLPELPQRLAVISSPTAAGYGDFCDQLLKNPEGYVFYHRLFPAIVQGDQAEASIITALEKIFEHADKFDAVVIIRGGGATTDMACFDSYELALNCAQFPLPVIVGIGHQRDMSILDMIAHTSVKTPTAAAEFFIEKLKNAEDRVNSICSEIYLRVKNGKETQFRIINEVKLHIQHRLKNLTAEKKHTIAEIRSGLKSAIRMQLLRNRNKLDLLEKKIETHSPQFLLKHGYTFTVLNGKRITSVKEVKPGDRIRTFASDGDFESEVK